MSTVAERLHQAREARKLTIEQVAEITKIRTDHLRALENVSRQLRDDGFCKHLKQAKTAAFDLQLNPTQPGLQMHRLT